jgi:hypothetical protein
VRTNEPGFYREEAKGAKPMQIFSDDMFRIFFAPFVSSR